MTPSVVILGPGRLGTALARRLCDAGVGVLGFVGRNQASCRRAIQFCSDGSGGGALRALSIEDLRTVATDVVILSVGDSELAGVVERVADGMDRAALRSRVWVHTSGFHGLDVLAPLRTAGADVAALHPLCPVPDAAAGVLALDGAPATLTVAGSKSTESALGRLAGRVGLRVLALGSEVDRARYHAACALAANGATALFDLVEDLLRDSLGSAIDARAAVTALMRGAVDLSAARGAVNALSGPVSRGDSDVVAAHLAALAGDAALPAYRDLMLHAVTMRQSRQALDESIVARLREQLGGET